MDRYRPVINWPYQRHSHKDAMDDFRFWGVVSTEGFYPLDHGEEWARKQRYRSLKSVRHFNKPDEALCYVPRNREGGVRRRVKPYEGRAYQYAEFFPRSWACTGYLGQSAEDYVRKLKAATKRGQFIHKSKPSR